MAKRAASDDDDDDSGKATELEESRMPFLSHLRELRDRVRNAALVFMAAFGVCWYFSEDIFTWLREPLFKIWMQHTGPGIPAAEDWGPPVMIYTGLTQPFWVDMSVGLWAGIFLSSPFIFYQLWKFIAPGLYKKERKITVAFAVFSAIFFVSGALFCFYFALPKLYGFFLGYNSPNLKALPNIQDYLDITRDSMLAFGAIFEMPLLIYFLAMVGLVTHRGLWKFSRYFVVVAFVIGAILTPGPDVVSQLLMALPMIALYNVSILLAWRVTIKREKGAKELAAREAAADAKERAERRAKGQPEEEEEEEEEDDDDDE